MTQAAETIDYGEVKSAFSAIHNKPEFLKSPEYEKFLKAYYEIKQADFTFGWRRLEPREVPLDSDLEKRVHHQLQRWASGEDALDNDVMHRLTVEMQEQTAASKATIKAVSALLPQMRDNPDLNYFMRQYDHLSLGDYRFGYKEDKEIPVQDTGLEARVDKAILAWGKGEPVDPVVADSLADEMRGQLRRYDEAQSYLERQLEPFAAYIEKLPKDQQCKLWSVTGAHSAVLHVVKEPIEKIRKADNPPRYAEDDTIPRSTSARATYEPSASARGIAIISQIAAANGSRLTNVDGEGDTPELVSQTQVVNLVGGLIAMELQGVSKADREAALLKVMTDVEAHTNHLMHRVSGNASHPIRGAISDYIRANLLVPSLIKRDLPDIHNVEDLNEMYSASGDIDYRNPPQMRCREGRSASLSPWE